MLRRFLLILCLVFWLPALRAQYISRSEPVPYNCPVICASGDLLLKVPQVQNFPNGTLIQAELSNASGSFAGGTQILSSTRYSLNQGASYTNGAYTFAGNVNDLYFVITLPGSTPAGTGYTIRMRGANGYVASDLFQCSSSNSITVTPFVAPLPQVAQTASGAGNWIGHVYTWTPTTGAQLNTPALVAAQNFFNPASYQGHVLYNALSFDINLSSTGGVPGTANNGTSMNCGAALTQNFSMRMRRTENFAPGYYQFSIQGDDGIRFSIDGGVTWILSAWLEQTYASSLRSTNAAYPNGICLSGPTDLVIEYFQRPADARITFNVTPLGSLSYNNPSDVTVCAGDNTSFSIGTLTGVNLQWYWSNDNGVTYQALSNGTVFSGVNTATLGLTAVPANYDNALFYCEISGSCGNPIQTTPALLDVGNLPQINTQPLDEAWCNGQNLSFSVGASGNGITYQWQLSTDGGLTFTNVPNSAPYSGVNASTLNLSAPPNSVIGNQYQVVVSGCGGQLISNPAEIVAGAAVTLVQQPLDASVCANGTISLSVVANNASGYQWQVFDGVNWSNLPEDLLQGYSNTQTNQLNVSAPATAAGNLSLRCVVSGGCNGDLNSSAAVVTVLPEVSILNQTTDQSACDGASAGFSINASGSTLQYQWQMSTDGGVTFTNLSNTAPFSQTDSDFLVINPASMALDGAVFRCVVSGDCNSPQITTPAALQVSTTPVVNQQPQGISDCVGSAASFSVSGSGNGTWQWELSTDGGLSYTDLNNSAPYSGVNSAQLNISALSEALQGALVRVRLESCGTTVFSSPASINLLPAVGISTFSAAPPACEGSDLQWSVSAQNATSYRWEVDLGNGFQTLSAGNGVSGVDGPNLILTNAGSEWHTALLRCVVSGACGEVVSPSAAVYLNGTPVITAQPQDIQVCSGGSLSLSVQAEGNGIAYHWQLRNADGIFEPLLNDPPFHGTQSAVLTVESVAEVQGFVLQCVVSGCGISLASDTARISILENNPVYIPNAFSPDGDFVNAVWQAYTEGNPQMETLIYNRWGELLHSWKGIDGFWDGTYLQAPVQEGIYVYRIAIETECETRKYMGNFQLLR